MVSKLSQNNSLRMRNAQMAPLKDPKYKYIKNGGLKY